ncbi:MAG: TetR/AcrR family transcriptional regulator [Myxococcales bacterium]|nr:TetR/AcrR family transcriptional regulator [Myxococcales bacterium]
MSKNARDRYHHGALRTALLSAAVTLIEERGVHRLSLRECARRAGVSHAAPYRHFADKDALLMAIAQQGFDWLHKSGITAMDQLEDPRDRLDAYGVAYVRFAIEHPVHLRVMFTQQFEVPDELEYPGAPAFELLRETAAAVVGPDHDPLIAAAAAWSLPHGLSLLVLDQRLPSEHIMNIDAVETLARQIYAMWRGPLGRSP